MFGMAWATFAGERLFLNQDMISEFRFIKFLKQRKMSREEIHASDDDEEEEERERWVMSVLKKILKKWYILNYLRKYYF